VDYYVDITVLVNQAKWTDRSRGLRRGRILEQVNYLVQTLSQCTSNLSALQSVIGTH